MARSQEFVGFGTELKIQMPPLEVSEVVVGSGSMLKITRFGNDDVVVKELLGDRFAAVRESHHLYLI
ncbi:MAG: hypothetical protein ABR568_22285, partial [Pyrinomonadaceae bacterium]